MQEDPHNYGRPRGADGDLQTRGSGLSIQDERTWSSLAHLSVLVNLVTGFGGLIAAPVIWLVYRERSPRVAFHALQSFWYQAAWAAIFVVGGLVSAVLLVLTLGIAAILLVPLWAVVALVPFIHGAYAAYQVNKGVDYRYPFIADQIDARRAVR